MKRKYVKICKLAPSSSPEYPTPSFDTYEVGKVNGEMSIPTDYWLEGYLIVEPTVGRSVIVDREVRCGIKTPGIFTSSEVTEVTDNGFKTLNSIYSLEYLK